MNSYIKQLTVNDINTMPYVDFISLLKETNRCPGGKKSIKKIIQNSFINEFSNVLEIGSNTGFTSLEIARTIKCKVSGVDPNEKAVEESNALLSKDTKQIQNLVSFQTGSAYELPFDDNSFDLAVAGGATSFMDDKQQALDEYYRVLKDWAFLSITNLCYVKQPPAEIVEKVGNVIGVKLNSWGPKEWLELFEKNTTFEIYHQEECSLNHRTDDEIKEYVDMFLQKEHLKDLPEDIKQSIWDRWYKTISIFNENHKYLGYILVLFRKRKIEEEVEFF